MTAFDYAVLGVLAVSVLVGLWRGVIGELLALAAWVAAIVLARSGGSDLAAAIGDVIAQPLLRLAVAYAAIFLGTLLVFAIGRRLLSLMVRAVGLGLFDRLLGGLFGVLRGMVIVLVAVMVAGMTPLPRAEWWTAALLAQPLETAVIAVKPWLPQDLAKRISYR